MTTREQRLGSMVLRILSFALIVGVTSCGGDSDDIPALSGSEAAKEDLTVSNSNSDLTVEKTNLATVYITGNNNIIRFAGVPELIEISGNDNTIYAPGMSQIADRGDGNMILDREQAGANTFN